MSDSHYPGIPSGLKRDTGLLPPYVEAALFLLCGMIIGGGATVLLMDWSLQQMLSQPDQMADQLLLRMDSRLEMTEAQQAQAAEIIDTHFATLDKLRRGIQPEIQSTLDALRDDLAAILDDSQRSIWVSRFDEVREKWQPGPIVPTQEEAQRIMNAASR